MHADNYAAFSQEAMLWHLKQEGGDETPCAFEHATGQDFWSYLKAKPAVEQDFMKAMQGSDAGEPCNQPCKPISQELLLGSLG